MIQKRILVLMFLMLALTACNVDTDDLEGPSVQSVEGGALLAEATRAALRAINERKTATLQAATLSAGATRDADARINTATAQALQVRQTEMAANATSNALALVQVQTRQASTETSAARRAEATSTAVADFAAATETAELRAMAVAASRTALANEATATAYAATSTRSAAVILEAQERKQATATAEAIDRARLQAQQDAARSQSWADFFDSVIKIILGIGSIALLVMLIIQLARYLDAMAMRQKLVETRAGTVMVFVEGGKYRAQLVSGTPRLLEDVDDFETQAPVVDAEADDLLKLTTSKGENWIAKSDPEAEAREARRRLAMRLLREACNHYTAKGISPNEVNRIPTANALGMPSATWQKAIHSLKPNVITRDGRAGGTFVAPEFASVLGLRIAVGERRVAINLDGEAIPVPPTPVLVAQG